MGSRRLTSKGSSGWRSLFVSLFFLVFCKLYLPLPTVNLTCICQICCVTQDLSRKTEAPSTICSEGHWMQGTGGAEKTKLVSPLPRRRWGYRIPGAKVIQKVGTWGVCPVGTRAPGDVAADLDTVERERYSQYLWLGKIAQQEVRWPRDLRSAATNISTFDTCSRAGEGWETTLKTVPGMICLFFCWKDDVEVFWLCTGIWGCCQTFLREGLELTTKAN